MSDTVTDAQLTMLNASVPDDITGKEGVGVELRTGADYAIAKALKRRGWGEVTGPGGALPGMYWSNADGLRARLDLMECCPVCGACPGFIGVDCDGDCEWYEANG
jgi:hypothetical protein